MTDQFEQQWQRLNPIIDEMLELPPQERAAFGERACAGDLKLRAALTSFLAALEASDGFLENSRADEIRKDPDAGPDFETLNPGHRIGNYEVKALIGRGGMGDVYSALRADGQFEHQVAIKIINASLAHETAPFLAERRILARLEHPGITRMFDGGVTDGRPYMVMELVKGEDLLDYCDARSLNLAERLRLFMQLCEAVAYAHRNLVVHRDIKPRNVLVDDAGNVKLLDFGIAQLIGTVRAESGAESLRLTPSYAAPEQISGGAITTATDVYALGCLLYRLLTGEPALDLAGAPIALAVERVFNEQPQPASHTAKAEINPPVPWQQLRGDLDAIIAKALAKDPAKRYDGAANLGQDIENFVALQPVEARGGGAAYRLGKFIRRNRLWTAAASIVSATVLVSIVMIIDYAQRVRTERDVAVYEASENADVKNYLFQLFKIASESGDAGQMTVPQLLDSQRKQVEAAPSSPDSIRTSRILGELYLDSNDNESALKVITAYLKYADVRLNPTDVAAAHFDLAMLYEKQGNSANALTELETARSIWAVDRSRFGSQLLQARTLEAQLMIDQNQLSRAQDMIRQVIADTKNLYGDNDFQMANIYGELSAALQNGGKFQEALDADNHAWELLKSIHREHSIDGLNILNDLALSAYGAGKVAEAAASYQQAVELRRSLFGPSSGLAALLHNYGKLLAENDRLSEALPLLREAEGLSRRYSGDRSFLHFAAELSLGNALMRDNDLTGADVYLSDALELSRSLNGENSFNTAVARLRLAPLRFKQGKLIEGRSLLDESEASFRKIGPDAKAWLDFIVRLRTEYEPTTSPVQAADKARSAP